MPRVTPCILRKALEAHPLLPLLLPACRTLEQSKQELRWMHNELQSRNQVKKACLQRSKLFPLQYILGTQPFGGLDLICRPGVLIPRWETEEWVCELGERLMNLPSPTKRRRFPIWDLCCGTGCVGLELQRKLGDSGYELTSVDLMSNAIDVCRENVDRNGLQMPRLIAADVLTEETKPNERILLLTCNPPYISRKEFAADTSPSVKRFEPRVALVGDLEFYSNLVSKWIHYTDSFVYEVGDWRQIECVAQGIANDPRLKLEWCAGYRTDSSGCPRVVYGYKAGSLMGKGLSGYGELLYRAPYGEK